MLLAAALEGLAVYQVLSGEEPSKVTSWIWITVGAILTIVVPFIAYHKMRVRLEGIADTRSRALARLILVVRDTAAEVVTLSRVVGREGKTEEAYLGYQQAIKELTREAEIESLQDVVSEHFTTYVSFHVARFLGGIGKIVGDEAQIRNFTPDEYTFIGAMATRANKTINEIKESIRSGK